MLIRKISDIRRTYRHLQRYRAILAVLFKYGFGDLVSSLRLEEYLEVGRQWLQSREQRGKIESLSRPERVRMALEELGPTFVKMGQMLSTRPDLLPLEFLQEFAKLQDDVAPFFCLEAKDIIESELGRPVDEVFQHFHEEPLGSASLGQVHRAQLAGGEEVVVKVQRPNIVRTIEVDLEIALHLATLMEKHVEGWEIHRPTRIVEEFSRSLGKELDYHIEASHMERFAMQIAGDSTAYAPKVYRQATATRVLTTEYVDGIKASDIPDKARPGRHGECHTIRGIPHDDKCDVLGLN